jgi:hypothetical protein
MSGKTRGQKTEDRGQKSEDGGQSTGRDRRQKSEVGCQKGKSKGQKTEDRRQKSEIRGFKFKQYMVNKGNDSVFHLQNIRDEGMYWIFGYVRETIV